MALKQKLVEVLQDIIENRVWIMSSELTDLIEHMTDEEKKQSAQLIHDMVGRDIRNQDPSNYPLPTDPDYCDKVVALLKDVASQWEPEVRAV